MKSIILVLALSALNVNAANEPVDHNIKLEYRDLRVGQSASDAFSSANIADWGSINYEESSRYV